MLILGSYGFVHIETAEKISENIQDKSGKMLIIPLASRFGIVAGEREKNNASEWGFCKENIFVFDESKPEDYLNTKFDYIVVPGGNTFKLLYYVKKFNIDSFIRQQVNNGADYLGFSAGAYLACPNVEYVRNFDDNNHITDNEFSALGLTDKYVLCHFDCRGNEEIRMCRNFIGYEAELITIKDNQLIVL